MTTHTIPAEWLRVDYAGSTVAQVKVHENDNGEFFDDVVFIWTNPTPGSNTKFALVAEPAEDDRPFLFAVGSVIAAGRLYDEDPPVVKFATGDVLDIEGVGQFTIAEGAYLSHGVRLIPKVDRCVGCFVPMPGEHARGCPTGQNGPPRYD